MMSIEQTMKDSHRGVRERLGLSVTTKPVVVPTKRAAPFLEPVSLEPFEDQKAYSVAPFSVSVSVGFVPNKDDAFDKVTTINDRWKDILREVCQKHNVTILEVRGHYRQPNIVRARHEAFYRMRTETTMSFPVIAKKMGNFDPTTVLSGYQSHIKRALASTKALEAIGK